jgi:cobyrinic acid a,c-diamide synthase
LLPEVKSTEEKSEDAAFTIRADVRIGLARDNAFCFYYQDNLDMLEKNGAQLVEFSPMDDKSLPKNLDGIYLGGGYPELFAKQLSDNVSMRRQIKESSKSGMPVYGECGGFMYLCREIWDTKGNTYPMVGCFDFATQMFTRLKSLGYREIKLVRDTLTGKRGETIRGHEFHYSEIKVPGDKIGDRNKVETVYDVFARAGINKTDEGYMVNRTLGSYIHLHFGSRPEAASCFVESCRNYKREKRIHL